jgi:hypothetical protein
MDNTNSVTRRRLLFGISTTGIVATAGCTGGDVFQDDIQDSDGDGVIDSEDYAPQDPEVQEKSDIQSGGDSPPTETNTPAEPTEAGEHVDETSTATGDDTPTVEETLERKREALTEYQSAYEAILQVNELQNQALDEYNDGIEDCGEGEFQKSHDIAFDAAQQFEQAATLAFGAGDEDASEMADGVADYTRDILVEFSEVGRNAAVLIQAQQEDYRPSREESIEEMNDELFEINDEAERRRNNSVDREPSDFEEALGL